MSLPKRISYYPSTMLEAIDRAIRDGEFLIPLPGIKEAKALSLQFQGLRGAMVKEGQVEKSDAIGFYIQQEPPALILRRKEKNPLSLAQNKAIRLTQIREKIGTV